MDDIFFLKNVSLSLFKPNPSQLATNLLVMLSKQVTRFQDLFISCFWMFTYHLLHTNQLFIDLSWANTDSKEYFTEQANEFSASVLLHKETLFIVHEFILELWGRSSIERIMFKSNWMCASVPLQYDLPLDYSMICSVNCLWKEIVTMNLVKDKYILQDLVFDNWLKYYITTTRQHGVNSTCVCVCVHAGIPHAWLIVLSPVRQRVK